MGKKSTLGIARKRGVGQWSRRSEMATRSTRSPDGSAYPGRWSDDGYDVREGNGSIEWTGRASFLAAANLSTRPLPPWRISC
jgi:hypothetical protein